MPPIRTISVAASPGAGQGHAHAQPAIGLVTEKDFDGGAGRQALRQIADRAMPDRGAVVRRGALAFDDIDADRPLAGLLGVKDPLAGNRQGRVSRNAGCRCGGAEISGSVPTTPRLCELTLRILNRGGWPCCRARISQACSGAVGDRLVGGHRVVGFLAGKVAEHLADHRHPRRAAHQQHAIQLAPIQPCRPQRCTVVNRVRSRRSAVACSNCCRTISIRAVVPRQSQVTAAFCRAERGRLASSQASRSLPAAKGSPRGSRPCSAANRSATRSTSRRSQSHPPRHTSPSVARALNSVPRICTTVTSKVPPPRS